jgi:very-short-patch-repair endonuclease
MHDIPATANRYGGVFTRAHARTEGMSYRRIERLIDRGLWQRVVATAFVAASMPVTPRRRAWAAHLLTGASVSHATAARLYRIDLEAQLQLDGFHVTVDPNRVLRVADIRPHRLRLPPSDRVQIDGIPATSVMRTVVDLLASLPIDDARRLRYRARQHDWLRDDELEAHIAARAGWAGTPQLRLLLSEAAPGAHSTLESALHTDLRRGGITGWRANVAVMDAHGLIGVADVLFEEIKLVLEADGRSYHGEDRFQHDRTRQNRLTAAGYTVLRFTYDDIIRRPTDLVATVRATIARLSTN